MHQRIRFARFAYVVTLLAGATGTLSAQERVTIPTRYIGDRFFASPVTLAGDTLGLLMDTGGGVDYTQRSILERAGFTLRYMGMQEGDSVFVGGKFPAFKTGLGIPVPLASRDSAMYATGGDRRRGSDQTVGALGNDWFAGRVWVFDYPRHEVSYYASPPAPRPFDVHTIPMTTKGKPRMNHPRIRVDVDGDTVDMLLDTGATSTFESGALALLPPGPTTRASAFVSTRQFDKWHAAHPDWRMVPKGESFTGADFIEVKSLKIAGYDVGPIWFAKRPDSVYDGMMARIMDKPIEASLGGAALKSFRITLDYPNQRATFER